MRVKSLYKHLFSGRRELGLNFLIQDVWDVPQRKPVSCSLPRSVLRGSLSFVVSLSVHKFSYLRVTGTMRGTC